MEKWGDPCLPQARQIGFFDGLKSFPQMKNKISGKRKSESDPTEPSRILPKRLADKCGWATGGDECTRVGGG